MAELGTFKLGQTQLGRSDFSEASVQSSSTNTLSTTADTQTTSPAVSTTLATGTVLASSGFTAASGAELLSINGSPLTGSPQTSTTSSGSIQTGTGSGILSSPTASATSSSSTTATSVTTLLSDSTSVGTGGVVQTATGTSVGAVSDTQTTGTGLKTTVLDRSLTVGDFVLGETELGTQPQGPLVATSDTTTTGPAFVQSMSGLPVLSSPFTSTTSVGSITEFTRNTLLANSTSEGIGGIVQSTSTSVFGATVFSSTTSDGDITTPGIGTVLAASADTAASGAELLKITAAPATVDPDTTTTSTGLLTLMSGTSLTVDPDPTTTGSGDTISVDSSTILSTPTTSATSASSTTSITTTIAVAESITKVTGLASVTSGLISTFEASRFIDDWALENIIIGDTLEEVREWDRMELTIRTDRETVINDIRPKVDSTGKVNVIEGVNGGFSVIDRSGNNQVTLKAPTRRKEIRPVETWYLLNIEEEPVGKEADEYEVTIEVAPTNEKAFDNSLGY